MEDTRLHHTQKIWEHRDALITTNNIHLGIHISKDQYGICPASLQVNITNYKSKLFTNFSVSHQVLFYYLLKFKEIYSDIENIKQKIALDQNYIVGFPVKDARHLTTEFLYRQEYCGLSIRISIGEANRGVMDSDACVMSFNEYLSMVKVMTDFRDKYIEINTTLPNIFLLNDLSSKLDSVQSRLINIRQTPIIASSQSDVIISNASATKEEIPEVHVDMLNFIKENIDKMDIGLDIENKPVEIQPDTNQKNINESLENVKIKLTKEINKSEEFRKISEDASIVKYHFTKDVFNNNILELEDLLINCLNSPLPLQKFIEFIEKKLNVKLNFKGELSAVEYITTCL